MTELSIDNTRERLLDHAESLFAQKGFEAVSVREITAAARSNLAAVNYHFGNKHNLYYAVFRERWVPRARRIRQNFMEYIENIPEPDTGHVFRALSQAFLKGVEDDVERRHHFQLMQREVANPTDALNMVMEEVIRPTYDSIFSLIRPALPPETDDESLRLSIASMIGMILYFGFAQPVISRLTGRVFDDAFKARVIDHIVSFGLHGINGLKREK